MMFLVLVPLRYSYKRFMYWAMSDLVRKDLNAAESAINGLVVAARCFKPVNTRHIPAATVLKDEELQGLKVPALCLFGENEVLYSAQEAVQRLNEVAPQMRAEVIPNAGHDLIVVQAEMVNQKILEFLALS
jgi:pimeloyl-ACP methyl ester carboxylesterase